MKPTHDSFRDDALRYLARGWSVLPIQPRSKLPLIKWQPCQDAPAPEAEVRAWFTQWPTANLGIVTGPVSNLVVLDVDPAAGGDGSLQTLEDEHGPLPETVEVRTGGGGRHLFFRHPGGKVGTSAGKLGPGLDVRGDGGYVVAPPSVHGSGNRYAWRPGRSPEEVTLAALPEWLRTRLGDRHLGQYQDTGARQISELIPLGQRNDTLTSLAGTLRREGADADQLCAALQKANTERCAPPLPTTEVQRIAQSVARYQPVPVAEHFTDLGNARRLVTAHGRDLRYVTQQGHWLVWDGRRWKKDDTAEVDRRAKATVHDLYQEAATATDDDKRRALAQHALRSESQGRIAAMVRLAQSEPGVPVRLEELDTDPWRLNVPNGTLDLRTGALHPARPADLLTKLAGVAYDPTAPCPQWERFLGTVLNQDAELIRFLQKALGYTLTGDTREQCLFLLYGTGANGKSTLLTTVRKVCGDYARQTPTETLLLKRGDAIGNDVARLCGARFVVAVEAEGGRRLAEVLVKQLTGGDTVAVRYLYQEAFEYAPTFKLFLAVNHKPVVQGTDNAIWRRMRLIPFAVTIPIEAQDRELGDKLQTELPGILRWMVEGCLAWQREGLGIPQAVQSATEGYRGEQDVLAQFLTERCSLGQGEQVKSSDLYAEYAGWCAQAGESRLSPRELASRLQEGGYTKHRYKDGNMWRGLTLKKDEE